MNHFLFNFKNGDIITSGSNIQSSYLYELNKERMKLLLNGMQTVLIFSENKEEAKLKFENSVFKWNLDKDDFIPNPITKNKDIVNHPFHIYHDSGQSGVTYISIDDVDVLYKVPYDEPLQKERFLNEIEIYKKIKKSIVVSKYIPKLYGYSSEKFFIKMQFIKDELPEDSIDRMIYECDNKNEISRAINHFTNLLKTKGITPKDVWQNYMFSNGQFYFFDFGLYSCNK